MRNRPPSAPNRGDQATACTRGRARGAGARGEAGFTLLEMMVAVAILSILVGIVPRSFVAARAMFNRSDNWLEARLVAETVLNQELAGNSLRAGVMSGTIGGHDWSALLERDRTPITQSSETSRVLLDVRLSVKVSQTDTLEVQTMRIGSGE